MSKKRDISHSKPYPRSSVTGSVHRRKSIVKITTHWPTDITILDDDGNDVTMLPLYQCEDGVKKRPAGINESSESTIDGFSQASVFMTGLGSTQQFSRSVFRQSNAETNELPEDFFHLVKTPDSVKNPDEDTIEQPDEMNINGDNDQFEITLTTTELIDMIDMPAKFMTNSDERAEEIKGIGQHYAYILRTKAESSDCYEDKGINTFNSALKTKATQALPIISQNKGVMATQWDIHDAFNPQEEPEQVPDRKMSKISIDEDLVSHTSELASRGDDTMTFETITECLFSKSGVSSLLSPINSQTSKSQYIDIEAFKNTCRVMETYLSLNNFQTELAIYRAMAELTTVESLQPSFTISKSFLRKLWKYPKPEKLDLSVTCSAINPENKNLLAVGYGNNSYGNTVGGLVCCWSIKNPIHPGRKYTQLMGVTALSFSRENPNLLAAGLLDGTVVIYNVRSTANEPIVSNQKNISRHHGPVWGLEWVVKSMMDGEMSEMLISTSSDGRVIQWTLKKGLEGYDIMKLKKATERLRHVEPGGQSAKIKKNNYILYRNAECYCFDFSPKDSNIYFAGTNEGQIYKCSCSYNEQHIASYVGHTAPVYKVRVSPFVADVFVSVGADWKINLWTADKTEYILQLSFGDEEFLDVSWCPWDSCVLATVRGPSAEIWDLSSSTTDPIFVLKAIGNERFTCGRFSTNSKCLFIGDAEGAVGVYELMQSDEGRESIKLTTIVAQLIKNSQIKDCPQ